jgi:pimeloyl-ACP methyl ester carboxylesterase
VPHAWSRVAHHREALQTESFGPIDTAWASLGDGPPLLLVHGLMTHGYSFRYVVAQLAARYRVVVPDLPGAGASGKPDRSYHPDRLADWIGEFAAHVGIRGAPTVGNSLGGYLCLRLALRDPGALGPLIDLHSPGTPLLRLELLHGAIRLPVAEPLLQWLVGRDPERWCHRNTHYYDETLKSIEEARAWAEPLRTRQGVTAFHRYLRDTLDVRELRRFGAALAARRDRGEPFPVPLLLLYACRDPMVPPTVGRELAALIPSAELRWLDRASHFAHVDSADAFLAELRRFFLPLRQRQRHLDPRA